MTALPLPFDLNSNTSFSALCAGMQLSIDSTALGAFKTCPRFYYYNIIWGWVPKDESPHLTFGTLVHEAREQYDFARTYGHDHESALIHTLHDALRKTWNRELDRPWISGHDSKNRLSLIRSIVWYLDQYGEDDALKTIIAADGKPLVELSFRFDSGLVTSLGEAITLCGHGDRLAELNDEPYWVDTKTTRYALDQKFFAQFSPHNQFSLYNIAGKVVYKVPTRGVICDGLQVGVTFTRAKRHLVTRDNPLDAEWLSGFAWWVKGMESSALALDWPMNDTACDMYGGCRFRSICSKSPSSRQTWLEAGFKRRMWDPLQRRGDI